MIVNPFIEKYYSERNYTNYLDRKGRYVQMARELDEVFQKVEIVNHKSKILDFGCAVGFLVSAMDEIGYSSVYGYDISEWAVGVAKSNGCRILNQVRSQSFDLVFFLDVLEHMTDEQIRKEFSRNKFSSCIVRIPCADEGETNFHLEASKKDETHINCKSASGWMNLFKSLGYNKFIRLNLNTIYDSRGCFCYLIL
jgi:SAM-dependent methyltransferase